MGVSGVDNQQNFRNRLHILEEFETFMHAAYFYRANFGEWNNEKKILWRWSDSEGELYLGSDCGN